MTSRHYRLDELDAAQRYAARLRDELDTPVRVIRRRGEIVVSVVRDERCRSQARDPERRARRS